MAGNQWPFVQGPHMQLFAASSRRFMLVARRLLPCFYNSSMPVHKMKSLAVHPFPVAAQHAAPVI